jgi:ATPase subunit of ABC transporter with duplicated ATPase domains
MDEPTNHLDIQSREWIEEALSGFGGTILFVSHDRYFINKFTNRVWELKNGSITDFDGTFAEYCEWLTRSVNREKSAQPDRTAVKGSRSKEDPGRTAVKESESKEDSDRTGVKGSGNNADPGCKVFSEGKKADSSRKSSREGNKPAETAAAMQIHPSERPVQ